MSMEASDMSTEVATLERPTGVTAALSVRDLTDRASRIQEVLKKVMRRGVHYGLIPGCGDKPGLLKPGAEKILSTFELGAMPDQANIRDLGEDGEIRVRVIVPIVHWPSGKIVGHGVGECSSLEEKYAWRKAVCQEEFDEADPANRRHKWKVGRNGQAYKVLQIRTNPADVANTILKMSKKRGVVDGALTATACSDMFEQGEDVTGDEDEGFDRERAAREAAQTPAPNQGTSSCKLPGYMGKYANLPIDDPGIPVETLIECADGLEQSLAKPVQKGKEKWRERDAQLFPAIRREIQRRQEEAGQQPLLTESGNPPQGAAGDPSQPTAQEIFEDLEAAPDRTTFDQRWKSYLPTLAGLSEAEKMRINKLHAKKMKELV